MYINKVALLMLRDIIREKYLLEYLFIFQSNYTMWHFTDFIFFVFIGLFCFRFKQKGNVTEDADDAFYGCVFSL